VHDKIGWVARHSFRDLLKEMLDYDVKNIKKNNQWLKKINKYLNNI
jgi:hypothetical protein